MHRYFVTEALLFILFAQCTAKLASSEDETVGRPVVPVIDVFHRGDGGYFCIKIPSLTVLPDRSLFALGEARVGSCSDYTKTDLVYKQSFDNGSTWSSMKIFHTGGPGDTIGNAAPIVVNGDIVVLFNLNNSRVLMKRSTDCAETFSDAQDITLNTTLPHWKWVGLGPPAGLHLSNGRLLIPAYHTNIFPGTVDNGLISKGHALLSDDKGHSWRLSQDHDFGGRYLPNEAQAVELPGQRIAIFARGFGLKRTRTISKDWGEHWDHTTLVSGLSEPFTGVEGSTVACAGASRLVFSSPLHIPITRSRMTILTSDDEGASWQKRQMIDPGSSSYSSLAWLQHGLGLLYERSENTTVVFTPDHISFASINDPCRRDDYNVFI